MPLLARPLLTRNLHRFISAPLRTLTQLTTTILLSLNFPRKLDKTKKLKANGLTHATNTGQQPKKVIGSLGISAGKINPMMSGLSLLVRKRCLILKTLMETGWTGHYAWSMHMTTLKNLKVKTLWLLMTTTKPAALQNLKMQTL